MEMSVFDAVRRLAWPTYFVAFLLVAATKMGFLTKVWPLRFGQAQWRYGSFGLLAGFLLTLLLGIVFAKVVAAILEHRDVLRVVSLLDVVAAVLLLIALPLFVLDVLQIRGTVDPEARSLFDNGEVTAMVKRLTIAVALGWLGWTGIRATKGSGHRKRQTSPLVARSRQEGAG